MTTVFIVLLVIAILWPLKTSFKVVWCPRMARFNLVNYASDFHPPAEGFLYVTHAWMIKVIDGGEANEVASYERAGAWLCDYINRNGIYDLTPNQSFEVLHVLSRLKMFAKSVRHRQPNRQVVAELDRYALKIGWRVWREATFGDGISAICREVEYKRRNQFPMSV